ncbi:MAG: hypothetical protein NVSMB64_24090 [Candidatus Velthaea sp.]
MHALTGKDPSALVEWLRQVAQRRDLTLPAPADNDRTRAIRRLLAVISAEFADYRAVVTGARETVGRNGDQLAGIVASTQQQGAIVRETASAVGEAAAGAIHVVDAAEALAGFAAQAREAATGAGKGLDVIGSALATLIDRLHETGEPIVRMDASTDTINTFLSALGRLSRQAQVLAVNASIEAAHLADAGARFGIVALEVRKLSVSTRASAADVAQIVSQLREATARVAHAVEDSEDATGVAIREIDDARSALGKTQHTNASFDRTIAAMARVADAQRRALQGVAQAVEGIVRHADEAADASRQAAKLDLTALLDGAEASAQAWKIVSNGSAQAIETDVSDPLCCWLAALATGAEIDAPLVCDDDATRVAGAAVRTLIEAVNGDQRRLLADVVRVTIAIAHNGFAWRTIGTSLEALRNEIATVRASVAVSARGANEAADLAGQLRAFVDEMQHQHDAALAALESALERIATIAKAVGDIDGLVDAMTGAAARAEDIMSLIDMLSSETDLLSLNAAIEAAHAGELGRAFGVIAEEIRTLALSTHDSTRNITGLVADVGSISGVMRATIATAADGTATVTESARRVRAAIGELRDSFAMTTKRAVDVSTTAEEQSRALDVVLNNVERSATAVDADTAAATDKRRLELARLGSRAHAVAARRSTGLASERIREFAEDVASQIESTIDGALAGGRISIETLFDFRYRELDGAHARELARLFDVSRVPPEGFVPKKYASAWDAAVDEPICELLDVAFKAAHWFKPLTMLALDLNAFIYAYPRSKIADWKNDATDLAGNRVKRLNDDEYTLRVSRWGLGSSVDALGTRQTYEQFRAAGCTLERGQGDRPWGIYPYLRDTNSVYNELAVGYFVGGRRHGALRIIYDPDII